MLKEESEKMSKSKFNVDNPDDIVEKYGADTFRMYEMFLGPVEMSKPWDTKGIEGVHRFLRKLWRLFFDEVKGPLWNKETPTPAELKTLHKAIKKVDGDTETFSYNTAVSAFMVCVNELSELKCHKLDILQPLLVMLSPYAPHIAEELWHATSAESSVLIADYPVANEDYLKEANKEYPVSINGKMRTTITLPTDVSQADAEAAALGNETVQKWLEGKAPKKVIFVKGKMVNVVI
jgi:leucyl-tRNA synthetase